MFHLAAFNVRDGLDDYDEDFTVFEPLGDVMIADMWHRAELEAQRAQEALATDGESLAPGQTPAEDQVVGNDDQCGDIKISPNDARIVQTEEETDKTASNGARDSEGVKPG